MDMLSYFLGRLAEGTGDSGGASGEIQVIIPETTVELVSAEGTPLPDGWVMCSAPVTLAEMPSLVDGQTYKITIDNTTYDMKVTYHEAAGTYLGGNTSLLMDGTDNGEDYIFQLGEFQGSPTLMLFLKGEAGTHTVKLEYNQSEIDEIENLIDESGVLDSTEGTATEKVEQLIDKAEELDVFTNITNAYGLFQGVKSFPIKAVVNLPNATNIGYAFANWLSVTPKVEEVIVNAPNVSNSARANTEAIFGENKCVNRVVLNLPNETKYLHKSFTNFGGTEVVLGFSTKSVGTYGYAFRVCKSLKKIIGVLDFSSAMGVVGMFQNCNELEAVTFEPNTLSISLSLVNSSKLSAESIQSIIDGLATVTTAQTLTLHSAITLTDEQKATINAKGWTLAQ